LIIVINKGAVSKN